MGVILLKWKNKVWLGYKLLFMDCITRHWTSYNGTDLAVSSISDSSHLFASLNK